MHAWTTSSAGRAASVRSNSWLNRCSLFAVGAKPACASAVCCQPCRRWWTSGRSIRPPVRHWPMPTASCAGWRTACRCCAMHKRMPCRRASRSANASRSVWAMRTGRHCWKRWHRTARGWRRNLPSCWHHACTLPRPIRWPITGARCPRAMRRRCWASACTIPTTRITCWPISHSPPACARSPMARARGWTG